MTALKTRKPTGAVVAPLILLEGDEKSGRSWACAELSRSERIGRLLWMDLGEGAGDEYFAIEGADYELIDHDGSYRSIYEQIVAAREEAQQAQATGRLPVALVIDSMTALWDLLKDWIDGRARQRGGNKAKLARDPNAEIDLTTDLWNDATNRWRAVMTKLMTFPGPVVMIARGKEVVEMKDGKPTGQRDYRVEGQKSLAYDASVWVRMTRDEGARVIGARSVHLGIKPQKGAEPKPLPDDWTLDWLIFDALKYEQGQVRDLKPTGSQVERRADADEMREEALTTGRTLDQLRDLHARASAAGLLDEDVRDGDDKPTRLGALIVARGNTLAKPKEAVATSPPSRQGPSAGGQLPTDQDQRTDSPSKQTAAKTPARNGKTSEDTAKAARIVVDNRAKAMGVEETVLYDAYRRHTGKPIVDEEDPAPIRQFIKDLDVGKVAVGETV